MTEAIRGGPRGMRTFFVIWLGQVVSIVGSGLTAFGLAVWIFEQTGQATPFALTVMFGNLPRILLSPLAGAVADRWNRRRIMILADTGSAAITLGAFFLLTFGQLSVWHIYVIATLYAVLGAFQEPAYSASVTMLVPQKELARANGLVQMSQALEMLIAPLLAGVLFVAIGFRGIMLIDFITFFFAVGSLLLVHIPQPRQQETAGSDQGGQSLWRDALFGWQYLRARVGLMGLLLYFALVNFFLNFAAVLTGPLVLSFSAASALGAVQSVAGVGMLAGSIGISAWGGPQRRMPAVIGFISLGAIGLFVVGLKASIWVVGAGFFLLMFSVPFASGISQAIFQSKVAPDVQGRVFATRGMISRSMMPLAFLLAGPLADRVFEPLFRQDGKLAATSLGMLIGTGPGRGIGFLFMVSGLILVLAGGLAWANARIRNLEDELPDAVVEATPEAEQTAAAETAAATTT